MDLRWSIERRLELIEFRLYWEGRLNRSDLTDGFGISAQQASADISRYEELAPGNMEYDRSTKTYVPTRRFKPKLIDPSAADYLNELRLVCENLSETPWIGAPPPIGFIPPIARAVDWQVLRAILAAIRDRHRIEILYQSFSAPEPEWRAISPHALGFDGIGWHVRALCQRSQTYKNFSLPRISRSGKVSAEKSEPTHDADWHESIEITVVADPSLPPGQKKAIEIEYGMKNGALKISVRRSFLLYVLRRLGLDVPEEARPPNARRLKLLERARIISLAGMSEMHHIKKPKKSK